ncbi:hypothetical protein SUGI_0391450 [Cryptomeria japonica]|uniref:oligopeptide transporter 7-like n=1 Tax=Cryptomeria japonica TaxID=3369 RepID=UPI002408BB49|nr:oligopeptide transporter 7-like [Cryptomeria japonica]GLJ21304.1 hypothetical protein SUGI_0391450 [Cryptomeria japonica]
MEMHSKKEGSLKTDESEDEVEDQSPIEQVALTVPTTDDPDLPVLTFRMWVLGIASCVLLAFLNQFFFYRDNPLSITAITAQIAVLPLGQFMAATLPTKKIRFPGTKWHFTLNPGKFNMKEHALITILASAGSGGVYAVDIVTIMKSKYFYNIKMHPLAGWLLAVTTQMLGFGWAGLFRRFLVESAYMWWPANLVQVSIFRALHEKEKRQKGGLTRLQFFMLALTCSFAYYIIPSYFFGTLSTVSIACFIWKNSVVAHQIGSGLKGLGIGSFGLDWTVIGSQYLGSPLASPWFAIANTMVGFFIIVYVITPITYWGNVYNAKKFPIYSSGTYDITGNTYNITRVLRDSEFDNYGYEHYSKLHLSTFFAITYGVGFAALAATLSHVLLFHGKDIWRQTKASMTNEQVDVHTRLMKKNYNPVPQFWFLILLVIVLGLAIFTCEGFGGKLQLPWWGVFLACGVAFLFTLPVGIIQATTNAQPGLNIITEYIIGYLNQGKPFANVTFKTYGYISMLQALTFLQDFKLGHYLKIPPRSMFLVQVLGTLVAATVYFGTAWWMIESVDGLCDTSKTGNLWTCPVDSVFYSASIIWGVIGPKRMFGNLGLYQNCNWFFLMGALAPVPVWYLSKLFPNVKWIQLINMPVLIGATAVMPPANAANFISWGTAGFIFNYIIFRRHKQWWSRNNYILSGALDAGVAFLGVLCYFALQRNEGLNLTWWGGLSEGDHCPLANCPTAPGVKVDYNPSCPVF